MGLDIAVGPERVAVLRSFLISYVPLHHCSASGVTPLVYPVVRELSIGFRLHRSLTESSAAWTDSCSAKQKFKLSRQIDLAVS